MAVIKDFYPYLYGFSFTLVTDHNPLTALKSLKDVGGRLARWMMFLQQLKIEYKPGKGHGDAEALSRRPSGSGGEGGGGDGDGNVGSSGGEGGGGE